MVLPISPVAVITFTLMKAEEFIPDTTFGTLRPGYAFEFSIVEDAQHRVWIRAGKEIRLATPKPGGGYTIEKNLLSSLSEYTVSNFYPEKNGILWIATTDGLIRYNENLEKKPINL
jgi:hypothetical protein